MKVQDQFDDTAPLLEVEDLVVEYTTHEKGTLTAIEEFSFTLGENETFGLVGESGCGKSTVAKSLLGLLPRNGRVAGGEIRFKGVDLTSLTKKELNQLRWKNISFISQGAMNSLNPVHKISSQIVEAIQAHEDVSKRDARERAAELFELVGLNPERMDDYPHQFSGGMKQRAYIAMALVHEPELIVADEPTTALDVIVQDQILKKLKELQDEFDLSIVLITHDISVVAETCDRLGIMYAGKMMEYGRLKSIFSDPHNPYTLGLQNAFPSLSEEKQELISIAGSPPDLSELPPGCRFMDRCPFATNECANGHPPLEEVHDDHFSACYHHAELETMKVRAKQPETWDGTESPSPSVDIPMEETHK